MKPIVCFKVLLISMILLSSCADLGLEVNSNEELKLAQRGSKRISGGSGDVELTIGDITRGGTLAKIRGIDNGSVYLESLIKEGKEKAFQYGKLFYSLKINSFEEHLLHDDYAFISFRQISKDEWLEETKGI